MATPANVAKAQADAAAARERLLRSAHELQARVAPAHLAETALEGAKERGAAALGGVAEAAQQRPKLAIGLGVGLAAFLLRRPLGRLLHRPKHVHLPSPRHALPRPSGDQP